MPPLVYALALFVQSAFAPLVKTPAGLGLDKLLHVLAYAVLGFLTTRALAATRLKAHSAWLLALGIAMAGVYGISDEWHQYFVANRTAEVLDVVADFIGATLGGSIYYGLVFRKRRLRSILN